MEKQTTSKKYTNIEEDLRQLIFSEDSHTGDKLPSENVLAARYNVSRQTIRKALEILEQEGYIYAVHGSGRYISERTIHRKNSKNIAVILTYLSDYIFPKVISGIDDVLSENGYSIILKHTNNSRSGEIKCLEELLTKDVDGIIIEPSKSNMFLKHMSLFNRLDEYEIPYVFIQGRYESMRDKVHILMDDEKGAYLLTKHLIDTGHKNIYGIFKSDDSQGQDRHKGYAKALSEAGMVYDPDKVIWYFTEDRKVHPYTSLKNMIKQKKPIDAVVCYNDQIAVHAIKAIEETGLKVPDDISITGYDNSRYSTIADLTLTTIVHPQERLGEIAAKTLLKMIRGEDVNPCVIIEPELIIGNSCKNR